MMRTSEKITQNCKKTSEKSKKNWTRSKGLCSAGEKRLDFKPVGYASGCVT